MIGVYIHVPFCRTRCPYCDFVSEAVPGCPPDAYVDALVHEISAHEGDEAAGSVFFGGGTPSLFSVRQLARIFKALHARFHLGANAEITLEANPDDLRFELPEQWRTLGVNRISLGVQSLDDRVLRYLGRRHDADTALRAVGMVGDAFDNWNMDLIFGAAPTEAWAATLAQTAALRPPHVAAYGLTYEPDTPFGARAGEAMEEDAALELYRAAEAALYEWDHYEISNFALPGRQCRHNLVYWHNEEYAGFGTGAYSFLNGVRARNSVSTAAYLENPRKKDEFLVLTSEEIRLETVIQHLRLESGLERAYYERRFGRTLDEDFGAALARLAERGLVEDDGLIIRPTAQGFYLNNEIGLELVE
jgi:oxygen-independent coproporphyrinogen-3 oxidase